MCTGHNDFRLFFGFVKSNINKRCCYVLYFLIDKDFSDFFSSGNGRILRFFPTVRIAGVQDGHKKNLVKNFDSMKDIIISEIFFIIQFLT